LAKKVIAVPIHPAGIPFILGFLAVTFIFFFIDETLGALSLVLTAWCTYFFRNPDRYTPADENLVIAPADGIVSMITETALPPEITKGEQSDGLFAAETVTRVSIFLNVFDVHVNRFPVSGDVTQVIYQPGKFLSADLDKASLENERSSIVMKIKNQTSSIAFVQIAGLVARRIICNATVGQTAKAGQLYGLIRFGSRVDLYLPKGIAPMVSLGQRMIGGETVIADLSATVQTPRLAEKR
jgi:phosphatidylserine decarboxylase